MEALAFEVQHHVDDVFEHAWPGNGTLFGDMPHDDNRDVGVFGDAQQAQGPFAHLPHRPCCRAEFFEVYRLDGVDNHHARALVEDVLNGHFEVGFRRYPQVFGAEPHAIGAQFDLLGRFFGRNVQSWPYVFGEMGGALQE